ncbi:MAG: hypothetical protein IJR45_01400, partial [Firmicutes bacterium]|nr:hypothetical protein [Bacillota bacterium]
MDNRTSGRKKHVTGDGYGLDKRGSGLNSGPVGTGHGSNRGSGGGKRAAAGGGGIITIIIIIFLLLNGGGQGAPTGSGSGAGGALGGAGSIFSALSSGASNAVWSDGLNNTGKLITTVADGSRDKYTDISDTAQETHIDYRRHPFVMGTGKYR